jgi:hypothetical protein
MPYCDDRPPHVVCWSIAARALFPLPGAVAAKLMHGTT